MPHHRKTSNFPAFSRNAPPRFPAIWPSRGGLIGVVILLSSCQNGDGPDVSALPAAARPDASLAVVPDRTIPPRPAPVTVEDRLWLGRRTVPLAGPTASSASGPAGDAATVDDVAALPSWQVRRGESVSHTVRRWAEQAGYTALPDFTAHESWSFIVSQSFVGSFEDALVWLSTGFADQPVRPVVVLFANHTLDITAAPTPRGGDRRLSSATTTEAEP